jgi:hypothetical protein
MTTDFFITVLALSALFIGFRICHELDWIERRLKRLVEIAEKKKDDE